MNKKLVIVVPIKKEDRVFVNSCESGKHLNGLRKFAYHNDLNVASTQFTESKDAAVLLTELGYCVMLTTEFNKSKNIEIFIPQQISPSQLEYFEREDIKDTLSTYNIVLYKYSDNKLEIINKTNTNNSVLTTLIEELHNRSKTNVKAKQLKKSK